MMHHTTHLCLDPAKIPEVLWPLIKLAEQFGFEDDALRHQAIRGLSHELTQKLQQFVRDQEHHFDAWLAGPEADADQVSEEYVAFTYLRIAAEETANR